ncbi:retrovirus-related pol polyprotein from transposon TNT 1-94 [Tanacetum coccineum]
MGKKHGINDAIKETLFDVITQLDINNAFLHGDLNEEVYMSLPLGYKPPPSIPNPIYKLQKSLYGLKQANRQWFTKLTTFLTELGFKQSYADTPLLTYKKDADFLALVHYVDDILLAGNNNTLINHLKDQLDSKFSIRYALELLHTASILDVKPSHILIDPNIKLNDTDGELLPDASLYRILVGKLLYLTITIPYLSYAAHCLSQFSHSPRTPHFDALIKPVLIMCDNKSSIALASNPVQHARTKHIEIDCRFVRDKMIILPTFIPSNHQAADVLTKGPRAPFHSCLSKFGMCDSYTLPTAGGVMDIL